MAGASYATVADLATLWRPMTPEEEARAQRLLEVVSASLRVEAEKEGRNLDDMIAQNPDLATVAQSVTVDVTARALMTSTSAEPASQFSQTAGPYTVSGTYLVPGGGIFIKKAELSRLGLRRQRYGMVDIYGCN